MRIYVKKSVTRKFLGRFVFGDDEIKFRVNNTPFDAGF